MDSFLPLYVFLPVLLLIQHFDRKAMKLLTNEQKGQLLDIYSSNAKWQIFPLCLFLTFFIGFFYLKQETQYLNIALILFISFMGVTTLISMELLLKSLSRLPLPHRYLSSKKKTTRLTYLFMLIAFVSIATSGFKKLGELNSF